MNEKALRLLGLARRARLLEVGEEPTVILCRSGKARLLLVAADAGEHTFRRAENLCRAGKPPMLKAPFTKAALGSALGCNACALCAFSDAGLAASFLDALEGDARDEALLDALRQVDARLQKRRSEARAHRNNVKHGRK